MRTALYSALCSIAILATSGSSLAQRPFSNTLVGRPEAYATSSNRAHIIYANDDGSHETNEFLYFKVYMPGNGNDKANHDWYTNPTAWLDPTTFHFSNVGLKMYNNSIQLGAGVLEFGSDRVKEANAGKIGYGTFAPGLNIIGGNQFAGSMASQDRRLVVFAEGGSIFNGLVGITTTGTGTMTFPRTLSNGADLSTYKLFVSGGILAKEVRVNTSNWADYVFMPGYKLRTLGEVEQQIYQLGHLPGMPSAKEIETDGFSVGEIAQLQQEKIEELTLYVIALKKEIDQMKMESTLRK